MMRRLLVLFLAAAAVALLVWHLSRPDAVPVVLQEVDRGTVEATVANTRAGTVEACRRSRLAPAVGGQVSRLTVKEGDRVQAGQVLLEIWHDDLEAQRRLAIKEAVSARARAEEACVLADLSKREADRQLQLRRKELVSEEQVDRAVSDAQSRRAACRAAQASTEVSEARVSVAHAAVERTILKAPFDGVVGEVNAELGEFVTPSPPGIPTLPAVDLIDDECLYVTAPIDEVDAPALRVGMKACVSLDAFPQRLSCGTVRRIAPYVLDKEKQARTVEVEVDLPDPQDRAGLLAGYSADVEVVLDRREGVLRIPTEAVLEGYGVLVLRDTDHRLEKKKFQAGLSNWQFTEVLSGLEAGQRVVVSVGREGVSAGAVVAPEGSESGAR